MKNIQLTKRIFNAIEKMKKNKIHDRLTEDLRPSEEVFLLKIGFIKTDLIKVSDIVTTLCFAPSTVSTMLKSLEAKDYVTRCKNEDKKCEVFVKITPKGKALLEEIKKSHFDMVSDLVDYLGEDDANHLIVLIEKISNYFEIKKGGTYDKID